MGALCLKNHTDTHTHTLLAELVQAQSKGRCFHAPRFLPDGWRRMPVNPAVTANVEIYGGEKAPCLPTDNVKMERKGS